MVRTKGLARNGRHRRPARRRPRHRPRVTEPHGVTDSPRTVSAAAAGRPWTPARASAGAARGYHCALAVVCLTVFVDLLGFGIILPALPFRAAQLGGSGTWVGAVLTAYAIAQFVAAPVLGGLSDRYGRRRLLLFSLAGSAVSLALSGVAGTLVLLLLARFGAGGFGEPSRSVRHTPWISPRPGTVPGRWAWSAPRSGSALCSGRPSAGAWPPSEWASPASVSSRPVSPPPTCCSARGCSPGRV